MPAPNITRDVIVIGGSAGGLGALQKILAGLSADLPAAVLVVLHQAQSSPGTLPDMLSGRGPLPVAHARDGETLELGRVYIAPPDDHLLLERGTLRLSKGPKENRFRPAIDPLFRTAARAYGQQVAGVILSGLLDDGSLGLIRVKQFGGVAIVQDPADAEEPDMPTNAMRNVHCDYVLTAAQIPAVLNQLAHKPLAAPQGSVTPHASMPESSAAASEVGDSAERGDNALTAARMLGSPTGLTCPQCGGGIWASKQGELLYFRCHVGHAYSAESMAEEHCARLESTLWAALRMFQENAALHQRMAEKAEQTRLPTLAERYRERMRESEDRAEHVRKLLIGNGRSHAAVSSKN